MNPLADKLATALRRHLDATLIAGSLKPLTAGAASLTYAFDAQAHGERLSLILQRSAATESGEGPLGGLSKRRLGILQAALHAAGLPVARVRFTAEAEDGLGDAFVMDRLDGESLAPKIVRDPAFAGARAVLPRQIGQTAAEIHSVNVAELPDLPQARAAAQLTELSAAYRRLSGTLPIFELAIQWLEEHLPEPVAPRLVHGDFRTGNFMVGPEGLRAILDWELAHLGDPAEDLAWVQVDSWRFGRRDRPVGGIGGRDDFYAAYEAAGVGSVDPNRVFYWRVMGSFKWGVMCLFMGNQHASGSVPSIERAAIGRRVSETELDLVLLLKKAAL